MVDLKTSKEHLEIIDYPLSSKFEASDIWRCLKARSLAVLRLDHVKILDRNALMKALKINLFLYPTEAVRSPLEIFHIVSTLEL